jgi:anti-sigma factor RsiW
VSGAPRPVSEDDLHAFVDHQLEPERRAEVERYIHGNSQVAQRIHAYSVQRDQLRLAFAQADRDPLPSSLTFGALIERRMTRRRLPWRAAAAVVVALLAGGAGGWWFGARPAGGAFTGIAADTAASYAVFTADKRRPVELWAAQREDLNRWVSNRLNRPLAAPDLVAVGYQFLGGRLVATSRGPGAMFMYENSAGVRLIVLARPMAVARSTEIEHVKIGGMDGCAWAEGGMGFGIIAAEPYLRLLEVSGKARSQLQISG